VLRIHVLNALETALDSISSATKETSGLEEIWESGSCGLGYVLKGIVIGEEFGDEVYAVARD
jgi:hypothetical protein